MQGAALPSNPILAAVTAFPALVPLDAPLLVAQPGQDYPVIRSKPSTLQQIYQSGPELLARLSMVADNANSVLDRENRQAFAEMLGSLRDLTKTLSQRSGDIDSLLRHQRPAVIVANHLSNYDLFVFGHAVPPLTVTLGKTSLKWIPFFGQLYWLAGNVLIERGNAAKAKQAMLTTTDTLQHKEIGRAHV